MKQSLGGVLAAATLLAASVAIQPAAQAADVLTLTKNDKYFDAPKPYLAGVEIRLIPDVSQRYNTLLSGAANYVE